MTADRCCPYCLGWFTSDPVGDHTACSSDCATRVERALRKSYDTISPADSRYAKGAEDEGRRIATGWGYLSSRELYSADVRIRQAAGLDVEIVDRWFDATAGAFKAAWRAAPRGTPGPACDGPLRAPIRRPPVLTSNLWSAALGLDT